MLLESQTVETIDLWSGCAVRYLNMLTGADACRVMIATYWGRVDSGRLLFITLSSPSSGIHVPTLFPSNLKPFNFRMRSGESTDQVKARLQRDLLPTLLKGLCYWPFCDILNFRFAPVRLQVGTTLMGRVWLG